MIINNWYVAAYADDLTETPIPVRMLGTDLVLFRNSEGDVACLSNVCCHRGGALSHGVIRDGCLACPYHGWHYESSGRVTKIPALGDDIRIPKRARVDSYPVQEQNGHIWVFLGDLPEAERPALPNLLPEYGDRETWRIMHFEKDWPINWMRLSENFADTFHIPFVHAFGKHLTDGIEIGRVEESTWGAKTVQNIGARPKTTQTNAAMVEALPDQRKTTELTIEISLIGLVQRNHQALAPGITQLLWNAWVPVDEDTTRHFGLHMRQFKTEPEYDDDMMKAINAVLDEDAAALTSVSPIVAPAATTNELFMEADSMEAVIRRKTRELGYELGAIDTRAHREEHKYQVAVIPSPARRQDPNNWVHNTVPLIS